MLRTPRHAEPRRAVGSRRDQVPLAFLNCLDSSSKTSRSLASGCGWHRIATRRNAILQAREKDA